MGFLDELKRLARPYEDEEEEEEFDDFEPVSRSERMDRTGGDRLERKAPKAQDSTGPIFPVENERRSNKVVNIHTTTQLQVVLVKPERFENASEIADHLREKRTVVLNLESTNKDIARRLLDFLSGVAYANEGKIKKVAISTYIITPYNVDILGDLIDELQDRKMSGLSRRESGVSSVLAPPKHGCRANPHCPADAKEGVPARCGASGGEDMNKSGE